MGFSVVETEKGHELVGDGTVIAVQRGTMNVVDGRGSSPEGLVVEESVRVDGAGWLLGGVVRNGSGEDQSLDQLGLQLHVTGLGAAERPRWRFFKNGYQSWTETRSFGADDRALTPNLGFARIMQDNIHNLSLKRRGDFRSDMFGIVGDVEAGRFILVGQGGRFAQSTFIRMRPPEGFFEAPREGSEDEGAPEEGPSLELVRDFGGQVLRDGAELRLDDVYILLGDQAHFLLDRYLERIQVVRTEREERREPPSGWCSWSAYHTRVSEQDVLENLESAEMREVAWQVFQLDDGYQRAVGDWLTLNDKFPDGLRPFVERVEAAGMKAGLWLAPFSVRRNARLFKEHRDWLLKDHHGYPASAGWNPMWGLGGRFYALDTTHPEVQAHLRHVVHTIVHDWGFRYLKLDFLYSAALYAQAHDPTLSPAERLQLGYKIIREAAGPEVYLLGCGAPLAASVGYVDGMRVGPDVAPKWFPTLRYKLTRDPHALSAKFAIRNTLTRAQLHGRLWDNDPDCLLVAETDTKLDEHERKSLRDAIVVSGGLLLLSERLLRVPETFWHDLPTLERVSKACAGGRCWPLDMMERETPELVFNSAGYLAVFNFDDEARPKKLAVVGALGELLPEDAVLHDVWTDEVFQVRDGSLDLGPVPRHGSRLLRVG